MLKYWICFVGIVALAACQSGSDSSEVMGYKYEHIVETGAQKPQPGEYVIYNYYLKDDKGQLLESSKTRQPSSAFRIPPDEAYPKKAPLIEMMKLMSVGDSARLVYPIDSLPESGRERFGDTKELIYELVIQDVKTSEEYGAIREEQEAAKQAEVEANEGKVIEAGATVQQAIDDYKAGNLGSDLGEMNGVEYVIHSEGEGEKVQDGDNITAHYYGVLKSDGKMFDNSFSRGQPFTFKVGQGQVIQGWDEGFKALKKGSKATLFIPYNMAYGEQGRPPMIPERSDLVFYVEVIDIR